MPKKHALIHLPALVSVIERRIYVIRGHKVMLDIDLAELYEVQTGRLNEQMKRNSKRFPSDFMFRLTTAETRTIFGLRSQFATLKRGKHRKYLPYVFTEQGVAMLSSVLHSERSIAVNIAIMRAFVRLREILTTNKELARKLRQMEKKYDAQFKEVFETIYRMMEPEPAQIERYRIGFNADNSSKL
ncbi:MAG: hypothetical protein JWO48_2054 [Bryobacterales bacterium]|nr:hypothetical protein [Bryobacterales bacterium]